MRNAVLYLRLPDADDASTSIAHQEADLRARAEREGWRVIATLTDDGFSSRKARAKAETALSMIADHEADVLIEPGSGGKRDASDADRKSIRKRQQR